MYDECPPSDKIFDVLTVLDNRELIVLENLNCIKLSIQIWKQYLVLNSLSKREIKMSLPLP